MKTVTGVFYSKPNLLDYAGQQTQRGIAFAWDALTMKFGLVLPGCVCLLLQYRVDLFFSNRVALRLKVH